MRSPHALAVVALALACVGRPGVADAQDLATAAGLHVIASDGTRVRVGEVTGVIEVAPTTRADARFGRIRVRAGLELDAFAGPDAQVPVHVVGEVASVLRVEGAHAAPVQSLRRDGARVLAAIVLGDAVLEDVPVRVAQVRVHGSPRAAGSIGWRAGERAISARSTRLCRAAARACVRLTPRSEIPVTVLDERRGWARVSAEAEGLHLEGWIPASRLVAAELAAAWGAGAVGAISDGCPYEGSPALVSAGTHVSLTPAGATWARIPSEPDSVWVHDTRPDSAWVEVTFARGVQRSFPGSTCSLGWVPRATVTFHHLREGALSLRRASENERDVIVVDAVPAWLAAAGLARGDRLLAVIERGVRRDLYDLDGARSSLGVGGTFVVSRDGADHEVRVPLAPGCEEPGAGQPTTCRRR